MLKIKNLHASVEDKDILRGIDLEVNAGEVHAIMGPNGSGKSTLAAVIAGKEDYEAKQGEILFEGENRITSYNVCYTKLLRVRRYINS